MERILNFLEQHQLMDAYYGVAVASLLLVGMIWWAVRKKKSKLVDTPRPNRIPYDSKTYRRR